jgi:hypothetical protein
MSDDIPAVETYRGVGIHDCQPRERIETVVKPALDAIFALTDLGELVRYAADITKPPEARLFAAAKVRAGFQVAADTRVVRPVVNLDRVVASVAGLNSRNWRCPSGYGSLLDVGRPGLAPRPPEFAQQVEDDRDLAEP